MTTVQETAGPDLSKPILTDALALTAEDLVKGAFGKSVGLNEAHLLAGLDVARKMRARGGSVEAMRMHAMLVLCAPMNKDLQAGLAECALDLEMHELAMQAASVVISVAPTDPRGYLLSGKAALGMGALVEAREDLTEAARLAQANGRTDVASEALRLAGAIA